MKKFSSRKAKSAQLEVQWPEPESFALITQQTLDGDRVAREVAQRATDRQASDRQQTEFQSLPIQ